jgi:hypothetical protein
MLSNMESLALSPLSGLSDLTEFFTLSCVCNRVRNRARAVSELVRVRGFVCARVNASTYAAPDC